MKRHKFNASPVWACKECCMITTKPLDLERRCRACGAPHAVCYFDSKLELKRWSELLLLQKAGEISGLVLKPVFKFIVNGVHLKSLRSYEGDAGYFERETHVVEDSKRLRLPMYRIKKELMQILYPSIEIREV